MENKQILDSWKEIAVYLNRSERCCRLWAKELGLPVHRLKESPRARVYAYKDEIDRWRAEIQHSDGAKKVDDRYGSAALFDGILHKMPSGESRASRRPAARQRLIYITTGAAVIMLAAAAMLLKPWRRSTASLTAANSVVVLPCKVYGAKDSEYLTEAIPGSLSTLLANVEGLDTRAPITNAEFERVQGDLGKVEALYRVRRFVQPFVTVESDQMMLNIQLLDSKTRRILWSKEYIGRRGNYLDLVHGTAEDLRQKLLPDSKPLASTSGLAANSEAELLLRTAKFYTNRYSQTQRQEDFDRAFSDLKRALDLDPKLADAAAGISWLYAYKELYVRDQAVQAEAEAWARRAIEIDPRCGRAWSALSFLESVLLRPDKFKSLDFALKAVQFAPRDPESFLALGNTLIPAALGLYTSLEAYRLNPLDLLNGQGVGFSLFFLGRSVEGLPYIDAILSVEPNYAGGLYAKILMLADLDRVAEAASLLPKVQRLMPGYLPPNLWLPLVLALQRGDSTETDRLLKEILNQINDPKAEANMIAGAPMQLLSFLVRHGRMEAALDMLKRNLEVGGYPLYDMLVLDPRLERLRRDARFKPILEKYRKNFVDSMKVLAQARSRGELPRYLDAPFVELLKKLDIKL